MKAIGETEQHSQRLAASSTTAIGLTNSTQHDKRPRLFRLGLLPRRIAFLGLHVNERRGMRDTLGNGNCRAVARKQIDDGCRRCGGRPIEILDWKLRPTRHALAANVDPSPRTTTVLHVPLARETCRPVIALGHPAQCARA